MAIGCPCPETPETCPKDCKVETPTTSEKSEISIQKFVSRGLSVLILYVVIGTIIAVCVVIFPHFPKNRQVEKNLN